MRKTEEGEAQWKRMAVSGPSGLPTTVVLKEDPDMVKPIERTHTDAVINFLARLACQVFDY